MELTGWSEGSVRWFKTSIRNNQSYPQLTVLIYRHVARFEVLAKMAKQRRREKHDLNIDVSADRGVDMNIKQPSPFLFF